MHIAVSLITTVWFTFSTFFYCRISINSCRRISPCPSLLNYLSNII